ncbi:MAG: tetratricopeptide repeat protein [Caldilineaceae bacterium]|nr:tetratricopeptide repeat protein [Caldilineaceae bacterium]
MSRLSLRLFGSPQVIMDGEPVTIARAKASALLYYLAMSSEPHQRNHLATLLWSERENAVARTYLRQALYTLSKELGDGWFCADRAQIGLNPQADVTVDVRRFQQLLAVAPDLDPQADMEKLALAAKLAHDDFLAGFAPSDAPAFDDWLFFQRQALQRQRADILTRLVTQFSAQRDFGRALEYAQQKLALDNLDEGTHQTLMRLYAYTGRKHAALRQYEQCTQVLADELGMAPAAETVALYESIRHESGTFPMPSPANVAAGPPPGGAPAGSPGHRVYPPTNGLAHVALLTPPAPRPAAPGLPEQPTHFVGRAAELDRLGARLADPDARLITVVAPGGMGKTRLALASARREAARYRDGVCFVALAALTDPADVATAVATALGITLQAAASQARTAVEQVCDTLRDKEMLLILDNFEHLLPDTAFVQAILRTTPHIQLLVTSRERLGLRSEHAFPIRGLAYDAPDPHTPGDETAGAPSFALSDAVRLFQQSAQLVDPDFVVDSHVQAQIQAICRLVEGMPLGIELAATWIGVLTPAEIAVEIERNLDFLETRYRDAPARHQSMRAVLDSTWQRLDADERAIFAALSVFHGGFSREAAREISGTTLRQLNGLVAKALIDYDRNRRSYSMHELLRQYGRERLNCDPAVAAQMRARHAAYYMTFLADQRRAINTAEQGMAADAIGREYANVRMAWRESVARADVDALLQAAPALFLFCQIRSRFLDGAELQAEAVASLLRVPSAPARDRALAQVLNHEGWLRIRMGDFARAEATLEESRRLYTGLDRPPASYTGSDPTTGLSIIYHIRGDIQGALALGEAARAAAAVNNDPYNLAHAHYVLTSAWAAKGDYATAARHAAQACDAARQVGNRWFLAIPLIEWGKVARAMGDYAQARLHFQAAYALKREFGDPEGMAVTLCHLGDIAVLQHADDEAAALFQHALELYGDLNDRGGLATAYHGLGKVARSRGDLDAARDWLDRALTLARESHFWPLVFAIFVDTGELLCAQGDVAGGLEILAFVDQARGADHEIAAVAAQALTTWQQTDPTSPVYAAAVARGRTLIWETAHAQVRAKLRAANADPGLPA